MRILLTFILLLGSANFLRAEILPGASIDDVLDALDARGQGLKSFRANVKLSDADAATGDATTRNGAIVYDAPEDKSARIHVTFNDKTSNGKTADDKIEYLLSGPDLIDRNYRTKTQVTRHVLRPGEKTNLLKLGDGPFPLPIGQKKEDVHGNFEVSKIAAAKDDPANSVHLKLTPKTQTRFEKKFKSIDVWVDQTSAMPVRIQTLDPNESTSRTTDLSDVKINPTLTDADFSLTPVDADWQQIEEAYNE